MLSDSGTIALTLLLGIIAGTLVIVLAFLLEKGPEGTFKRKRYEAGNPPKGEAKTRLPFQYYGYLLLYLSLEPLVAFLFLYSYMPLETLTRSAIVLIIILVMFLPVLAWGLKSAEEIHRWEI
jgi:NADH-quinone oxidoreductase subunit A